MTVATQVTTGYLATNWFTTTTPKTSAALTVQVGDVISVLGAGENTPITLTTPTGGSLSYVLKGSRIVTDECTVYAWQAVATAAGTVTISLARGSNVGMFSARYWQHRGSAGAGGTFTPVAGTASTTGTVTTTNADSTILALQTDWNAGSGNTSWATIGGVSATALDNATNTSNYGVHSASWAGVGTAGNKTVTGTFSGKLNMVAVSVQGSAAAGDTTAPTVPTGVTISGTTTTGFTVSWTASTDAVGVTGYDVQLGGVSYATPTGTTQAVTGRTPGTTYSVQVRARDAAGNWSALTTAVNATTLVDTLAETYYTGSAWVDVSREDMWTGTAWV